MHAVGCVGETCSTGSNPMAVVASGGGRTGWLAAGGASASIMPVLGPGNPGAPLIMIGRQAAHGLIPDHEDAWGRAG